MRLNIFADPDSSWLASWDHRTGAPQPSAILSRWCWFAYPGREGRAGRHRMDLSCGGDRAAVLHRELGDGQPHQLRLQLLPDGRMGVAVDGDPLAITTGAVSLDRPYRIMISGQSYGTRLTVGPVEIWTGVRDDIDWRAIPHR